MRFKETSVSAHIQDSLQMQLTAAQAEIAELKELIKREVVPDIKDAEIARLQSALDVAVEGLEYYANKDNWREEEFDCSCVNGVIKEEDVYYIREQSKPPYYDYAAGGIKANSTLDKIKQIRATNDAKRHMELSKVLDENGDR
jgi:hypothetical protein